MMFSYRIFHGERFKKLKRRVEMKNVMKSFLKKMSTMALFVFVMSSSVFVASSTATRNVSVIGEYGVSSQECWMGNGKSCITWNITHSKKGYTVEEPMPLTPIAKNSDNTYTLLTNDIYTRYFLTDASGKYIGAGRVSTEFKNAISWDGKSNIITY